MAHTLYCMADSCFVSQFIYCYLQLKRQLLNYVFMEIICDYREKHVMSGLQKIIQNKYKEVLYLANKAHKVLECKGVTRSDFKFFKNKFYILELNTQPGMTNLSLAPEIASYSGISFENLVEKILLDAGLNR